MHRRSVVIIEDDQSIRETFERMGCRAGKYCESQLIWRRYVYWRGVIAEIRGKHLNQSAH